MKHAIGRARDLLAQEPVRFNVDKAGTRLIEWALWGRALRNVIERLIEASERPIPMRLHCPDCHMLHVDAGEFVTKLHHTHSCQHCGNVWRPAVVYTVGVRFLPGFKDIE